MSIFTDLERSAALCPAPSIFCLRPEKHTFLACSYVFWQVEDVHLWPWSPSPCLFVLISECVHHFCSCPTQPKTLSQLQYWKWTKGRTWRPLTSTKQMNSEVTKLYRWATTCSCTGDYGALVSYKIHRRCTKETHWESAKDARDAARPPCRF